MATLANHLLAVVTGGSGGIGPSLTKRFSNGSDAVTDLGAENDVLR